MYNKNKKRNKFASFRGKHVCAKSKELQYGDTVSLPTPDAACTPEQQRRRNGLRCAALFLRLRTAPRTGLRPRAGWLRLRAGCAHASRGLKARAPHGRRGPCAAECAKPNKSRAFCSALFERRIIPPTESRKV